MPLFEYVCDGGHAFASTVPESKCVAFVHGKPCDAVIRRIGTGSRKATDRG